MPEAASRNGASSGAAERASREGLWGLVWRRFRRHRLAVGSGVVLALVILLAVLAPLLAWILGVDAETQDLAGKLAPPGAEHLLGTDDLGRDVLVRILAGGRVSLAVGLAGALTAGLLGTLVGVVAGYRGGLADAVLMRVTDGMLSLPVLAVMIVLAAIDLDKVGLGFLERTGFGSVIKIILITVIFGWMTVARLVRGAVLSLKEQEFILAARALGASPVRIMVAHLVPNCVGPIVVASTLSVGNIILYEAVLSFLGLGVQPPTPSWGNMLTGAQEYLQQAPHLAFYPGVFILVTVVCFNFIGDGLRDAMDPRIFLGR